MPEGAFVPIASTDNVILPDSVTTGSSFACACPVRIIPIQRVKNTKIIIFLE
jgi:hypothetical protein